MRDEFSQKVKTTLGQRVNYLCSNPSCHEFTSGPHSDDNKPLILGVAAHICAAALGGPRFNAAQTVEERKSAANGIWLCDRHAREIDSDHVRFPEPLLRDWKAQTETFVSGGNPTPSLPQITLRTLVGLRLIQNRVINQENADDYRDHELIVENTSRLDMRHVQLRVQFPESLVEFATIESRPAGAILQVRAPRITVESVPFTGSGGPGIPWNLSPQDPEKPRPIRRFSVMLIDVSSLPALQKLAITLVAPRPKEPTPVEEVLENNSEMVFRYNVTGSFAFDWNKEVRHLKTWNHLQFDSQSRRISSGPTMASQPGGRHVAIGGGLIY